MISCSPISSPGQAAKYYERDDYYARSEVVSEWYGRGAQPLGLSGAVDHNDFAAVLEGRLSTGDVLGRINAEGQVEHKCGYDVTFSAPKSISLAALAGGDQRLIEAHTESVKTTLDWLEQEAAVTRVKIHGQTYQEHTGNFTVAMFRHETSRAQDPQLHTHAIIANATLRADGQWRSIEGREVLRLQKEATRFYQNELAVRAQALGYEVALDRQKGRMELAAVPQEIRDAFSNRSAAIEDRLAALGKTRETASAREREQACLLTRDAKIQADPAQLRQEWQSRAEALGFDPQRAVSESRERVAVLARQPVSDRQAVVDQALKSAVDHLAERSASFRAADLHQAMNVQFFGEFPRSEIDQAVDRFRSQGELIDKPVATLWNSHQREAGFTTPQGQEIERQMLAAADRGRGAFQEGIAGPDQARAAIALAESTIPWNDQQRQAAEGILTSKDRFVVVQGIAGSAKTTTVLRTVSRMAELNGYEVRGLAPSAAASHVLEDGAHVKSQTVHSFLGQLRQAQAQGQ